MKEYETTLLLCRKDTKVLLACKKRGFGEGKWNGVGGKLNPGETPEQAMLRETHEEIMITPTEYDQVGIMEFDEYVKDEMAHLKFHLYVATAWEGEPTETEEMNPKWFEIDEVPYDEMFPDDRYWLPRILAGEKLHGFFVFDEKWNLLSQRFEEFEG